jgi:hypothetical protein
VYPFNSFLLICLRSGNLIIISGTTLAIIGLTWGGIRFPWNSAKVLAPLIIGMCLVGFFIYYEAKFPKDPTIPFDIIANRTERHAEGKTNRKWRYW